MKRKFVFFLISLILLINFVSAFEVEPFNGKDIILPGSGETYKKWIINSQENSTLKIFCRENSKKTDYYNFCKYSIFQNSIWDSETEEEIVQLKQGKNTLIQKIDFPKVNLTENEFYIELIFKIGNESKNFYSTINVDKNLWFKDFIAWSKGDYKGIKKGFFLIPLMPLILLILYFIFKIIYNHIILCLIIFLIYFLIRLFI